jgi:hypothetical protein
MKKLMSSVLIVVIVAVVAAAGQSDSAADRLRDMREGVWLSGGGTYTIWTREHYFVVSIAGDSTHPNIYCGGSQVAYTAKGIARRQNVRFRQMGKQAPVMFGDFALYKDVDSTIETLPVPIDATLFDSSKCVIAEGVIYDCIIEETDEYILLASCGGDKVKLFADGREAYLPAGGGEFWSYRVERW